MIARLWRGRALNANAHRYHAHFTESVSSALRGIDGYRGARLLRREENGTTEFLAVTFWESREHVRAFAGDDIDKAVVEPAARAVLSDFDDFVSHYEIVFTDGKDIP
jgi:heme-degrading monooxygenase HmoA